MSNDVETVATETKVEQVERVKTTVDRKVDQLAEELKGIELDVMTEGLTLSKLIRLGTRVTAKERGWGDGETACTLSAAYLAARALGVVAENKTTEGR